MTPGPVSLTVPADLTANLHGHAGASVMVPVRDSGTGPITVRCSVASVTAHAKAAPAVTWVRSIQPRTLTLRPGQTGYVRLTVHAPAGATGDHFVNVIFSAAPAGAGTVRLVGSVGGTLRIDNPGTLAAPHAPLGGAASPSGDTFPGLAFVAIVITAILVAACAAKFMHRRRKGVTPRRRWPDLPNR